MDLPTQKPQMLSQELSDLLQLTSGWLTLAIGSCCKASWEKTAGFGLWILFSYQLSFTLKDGLSPQLALNPY